MDRELFDQVYGSMLSSGAADGDSEITAAIRLETWDPFIQKMDDITLERYHVLILFQKIDHLLMLSGQSAQLWLPVGIGQAARIVDEIGIPGDAMLETEGFEFEG